MKAKMLLFVLMYLTCLVGNLLAQFPPNVVDTNYGKVLDRARDDLYSDVMFHLNV